MNKISCIDFYAAAEHAAVGNPRQNLYLLLDQAGLPSASRELRKHSVQKATLFDDSKEKSAVAVAPMLILVGVNGKIVARKGLFRWLADCASDTSSAVLLVSPLPLEVMRTRLNARLEVRLSEEIDALLRFYDPRIFEVLINALEAAEAKIFLGLASGWMYPNRLGQLETLKTDFHQNDEFAPPLRLSAKQEFALLEASEIDQVLDLLRSTIPSKMLELSVCEQYECVKSLKMKAQLNGVTSVLGYSIFASLHLHHGLKIVDSPGWPNFIGELRKEMADMTRLSELIDGLLLEGA